MRSWGVVVLIELILEGCLVSPAELRAMLRVQRASGITVADIARESGVNRCVIHEMASGGNAMNGVSEAAIAEAIVRLRERRGIRWLPG